MPGILVDHPTVADDACVSHFEMEQQSSRVRDNGTGQTQPVNKAPEEWKTGNEPMTAAQAAFLETLCREAGEPFEPTLTKAQASNKIQELKTARPMRRNQKP